MTNKIKYLVSTGASIAWLMTMASPAWAGASTSLSIPTSSINIFSITSLGEFIGAVLSLLFLLAGILVFAYLVWGGIQWITSGGDKAKTTEARDRITAALVGLAVIAIAWAIVILAQAFFGVNVTNITIPTPYTN